MNKLLALILFVLPLRVFALDLKVGDVLLQPLSCWSCSLIEAQERSIYSHMGIIIETEPRLLVAEALGTVRIISFNEFNARTEKGQRLSVRRLRDSSAVQYLQQNKIAFKKYFRNFYEGLQYDEEFLWNNYDEDGFEKLYCSEMVTKLLRGFMGVEVSTKIMKYDINRDEWIAYFRGLPPDGKVGNSPTSFEVSPLYYEVGEL